MIFYQVGNSFAVNDKKRVGTDGRELHQSVGTIFPVQMEYSSGKPRRGEDSECQAEPLADPYHVKDDEYEEDHQQTYYEKVQVLCL